MFSLAGCSKGNSRITPSDIYNHFKSNGTQAITFSEMQKAEPEGAFVVYISKDEMADYIANSDPGQASAYGISREDIEEAAMYSDGSDNLAQSVMSISFKDDDKASKYYYGYVGQISEIMTSVFGGKTYDGKIDDIMFTYMTYEQDGTNCVAAYQKDSCCLLMSGSEDSVSKMCTDLGLPSVADKE